MVEKRARQSRSKTKTMLTVFFDWEGVVHHKYAPLGQTINKEYYLGALCWLRDTILWKWPQLWTTGDWQLHQGNTPTHASYLVQSFLVKHQVTQVTQPPYSLDFISHDFWFFPRLKSPLKGKRFQAINKIQENMMSQLMVILTKDFAECFEQWKRHKEVPGCLLWRGLRCHFPIYSVSCILYLVRLMSLFHITWLDTFSTGLVHILDRMASEDCIIVRK